MLWNLLQNFFFSPSFILLKTASCRGRCGSEYYRGYMCQCDYSCLSYGECCKDFESQCTTKSSCKGRCGESFRRGRLCNCDSDCLKYNQCCPDYEMHCDAEDLCSGRPVSGVTTLRNGTTVVFRGHYFWFLDMNRVPGPAQGITQVWGVPSPIDTVFTRCNCQGKTYIFKGGRYWRFENDALDAGYPRAVKTGFDGLQGHITAALSVPQYNQRGESVYFFKRGGFVQKYSYQFGTSPSCGRKTQYIVYQASRFPLSSSSLPVSVLEPAINIRTSWRGFPTTVTAAVSIPSQTQPDGYKYYVFSRSKSYSVRMDSGRPAIAAPSANTVSQNEVFKCPKKV
uniref:Proteoglycan 4-like n=1 Tax=Gouania willdenowi TaxID=441366 RepID=A0A8C5I0D2_GOUWI